MADRWREEVTELREALEEDRCDAEARQAVRNMVEEIRLTPRDGVLSIDVKGNLAAMLAAASQTNDWQRQIALVAGRATSGTRSCGAGRREVARRGRAYESSSARANARLMNARSSSLSSLYEPSRCENSRFPMCSFRSPHSR